VPRWDRPLDHPDSPYKQSLEVADLPIPPRRSERPVESEAALWLYIAKGLLILIVAGLLLSNAVYALFALPDLLGG
jgi:hypothetical protein